MTIGLALAICALAPAPASASLAGDACTVASKVNKYAKLGCGAAKVIGVLKKVIGIAGQLFGGGGSSAPTATSSTNATLSLAALAAWVVGGAAFALHETATLLGKTTDPQLGAAWFSSTYVHMEAIAALLTLPFLFAAAIQALMRSDLAMLVRAAFGYLPLALLVIAIATQLTTLLLKASDGLSGVIEQAAGGAGTHFLIKAGALLAVLTAVGRSPFVAFLIGFFVAAGTLVLWLELLLREVAVYVIVLMLPLAFAALVWPARRVWAIRAVELLVALILAKLAIVSVLALGAGALDHAAASASLVSLLAGIALVALGAFAPWALVKLMPLGELAAAAAGPLRRELRAGWHSGAEMAEPWAGAGADWAGGVVSRMEADASGADAERARLSELGEAGSREEDSSTDGSEGVAGGGDPDPLRGTANPPDDPVPGAPDESAASGSPGSPGEPRAPAATPGEPQGPAASPGEPPAPGASPGPGPRPGSGVLSDSAENGPELDRNGRAERGSSPRFEGFEGAEDVYRQERDWPPLDLGPGGAPPRPEDDDDPLPPAQEPEDGRL